MLMSEELDDAIRENAAGPKRASVDGVETEQHPLKEQVEADRYLNSKKAARARRLGLRIVKIIPPGAE